MQVFFDADSEMPSVIGSPPARSHSGGSSGLSRLPSRDGDPGSGSGGLINTADFSDASDLGASPPSRRASTDGRRSPLQKAWTLNFQTWRPDSPEYAGIDSELRMKLTTFYFFCNRPTIGALICVGTDLGDVFARPKVAPDAAAAPTAAALGLTAHRTDSTEAGADAEESSSVAGSMMSEMPGGGIWQQGFHVLTVKGFVLFSCINLEYSSVPLHVGFWHGFGNAIWKVLHVQRFL